MSFDTTSKTSIVRLVCRCQYPYRRRSFRGRHGQRLPQGHRSGHRRKRLQCHRHHVRATCACVACWQLALPSLPLFIHHCSLIGYHCPHSLLSACTSQPTPATATPRACLLKQAWSSPSSRSALRCARARLQPLADLVVLLHSVVDNCGIRQGVASSLQPPAWRCRCWRSVETLTHALLLHLLLALTVCLLQRLQRTGCSWFIEHRAAE